MVLITLKTDAGDMEFYAKSEDAKRFKRDYKRMVIKKTSSDGTGPIICTILSVEISKIPKT